MKKIVFVFILSLFAAQTFAEEVKEVTLVASGIADSEQEATLVALRSAIEQTFGTFVSANTTIVNDAAIKDEIVSVSSGNIKSYKKLSSLIESNGHVSVTVEATVAIDKLISYAKSKGSTAEFAGNTFAMNIKLMDLRIKNTGEAYKNMTAQILEMLKSYNVFEYEVSLGDARMGNAYTTRAKKGTVGELYLPDEERLSYMNAISGYTIPICITVKSTLESAAIYDLIINTINSLKLSGQERYEYDNIGKKTYRWHPIDVESSGNQISNRGIYLPTSDDVTKIIRSCDKKIIYALQDAMVYNTQISEINNSDSHVYTWNIPYRSPNGYNILVNSGLELNAGSNNRTLPHTEAYALYKDHELIVNGGVFSYEGFPLIDYRNGLSGNHYNIIVPHASYYGEYDYKDLAQHISDWYPKWLESNSFSPHESYINEELRNHLPYGTFLNSLRVNTIISSSEENSSPRKRKKKELTQKSKVISYEGRRVFQYSIPLFVKEDEMSSFNGFKIERIK